MSDPGGQLFSGKSVVDQEVSPVAAFHPLVVNAARQDRPICTTFCSCL